MAYRLEVGDPGEFDVLHRCDNPPCVNPTHLWLGTAAENVADMFKKNRNPKPVSDLLTEDQVRAIRLLYLTTMWSYRQLGRQFGISYGTVKQIVRRQTWRHVL